MKKFIALILTALLLTGCAEFFEIVDIMTAEPTVHQGTVSGVEIGPETTVVRFDDGMSYTVENNTYVRPGETASIQKTDTGYRAELK